MVVIIGAYEAVLGRKIIKMNQYNQNIELHTVTDIKVEINSLLDEGVKCDNGRRTCHTTLPCVSIPQKKEVPTFFQNITLWRITVIYDSVLRH